MFSERMFHIARCHMTYQTIHGGLRYRGVSIAFSLCTGIVNGDIMSEPMRKVRKALFSPPMGSDRSPNYNLIINKSTFVLDC